MQRIDSWLGEELTADVQRAMRAWLEEDSHRQSQRPSYGLDDFSWSEEAVAPHFEEYLARYPEAREA